MQEHPAAAVVSVRMMLRGIVRDLPGSKARVHRELFVKAPMLLMCVRAVLRRLNADSPELYAQAAVRAAVVFVIGVIPYPMVPTLVLVFAEAVQIHSNVRISLILTTFLFAVMEIVFLV